VKRTALLVALFCAWTTALVAWGQVQRQTLPVASRPAEDTKQEIAHLKAQVEELARLKAEVDRLTKVIKVDGAAVRIEAGYIGLKGDIDLIGRVSMNRDQAHTVHIYSRTYFCDTVYARQSEFSVFMGK
jgi:hypothetical protein